MITWGITALSHDAALSVVKGDEILFAGHSERYSRKKNDDELHRGLLDEALTYGVPDSIVWYENPFKKKLRQLRAGQFRDVFRVTDLPDIYLYEFLEFNPNLKFLESKIEKMEYVDHHASHAAAGYYTSKFDSAYVIVNDAIGEFDTCSLWKANQKGLTKLKAKSYPFSMGLFYSAITQLMGLKPNEEEYILMGMAAFCDMSLNQLNIHPLIQHLNNFIFKKPNTTFNLSNFDLMKNFHKGIDVKFFDGLTSFGFEEKCIIARYAQLIIEQFVESQVIECLKIHSSSTTPNIILAGGVALNCVANGKILKNYDVNIWIMPNPGDAGSSLGAALAKTNQKISNFTPYLGTNIGSVYPVDAALSELLNNKIVGVASGRAEFGPRALGNRSILADPRGNTVRTLVNVLKKRDRFRPFAPVIMQEHFASHFSGSFRQETDFPYMQYTFRCLQPKEYPGICHVDGTSRVQTVNKQQHPGLYSLLEKFYQSTGCPMLLNTSLNIKGQPLVNSLEDAREFSEEYGVTVLS